MNASGKYGMLYTYFLEVSKDFIDTTFRKMQIVRDRQRMYQYFFQKGILKEISKFNLAEKETERFPWRKDQVVNLEKLDILLSFHIIEILGRETKKKNGGSKVLQLVEYLVSSRNYLCHLPLEELERDMSQEEFDQTWEDTTDDLMLRFNVDRSFLERCRNKIR